MSDPLKIEPATRVGIRILLCLWGGTGGGKTESALRLARGLAGPKGRIGVIDTEAKRASYYADVIPGGFQAVNFAAPYTPERYIEALDVLEKHADVGVIDSASHCWEGPDGILDLHEQALDRMTKGSTDYKERERLNWPAWREPKQRWKPLRSRILGFELPLIVCFRGEPKTHMEKDSNGRNTIITDATTSPIFDKKFIFEAHVAMEVYQIDGRGGFVRYPMPYAKTSHPDIRKILPNEGQGQLSISHGEQLAAWCAGTSSPPIPSQTKPFKSERDILRGQLWDHPRIKAVHNCPPGATKEDRAAAVPKVNQFLIDESFILDTEQLGELGVERLKQVIAKLNQTATQPQY